MELFISCHWDTEGHTLDIWLRKQRDNHSYAFIKRLIKQFGKPQKVVTDQAPSTKAKEWLK
jgi:putative transposase